MSLALTPDPRIVAFRWLVTALKSDPDLKRVVRHWFASEGKPNEFAPLPMTGTAVRLAPQFEPETPHSSDGTNHTYECPVRVTIEAGHIGSDAADAGNLAGAIFAAAERAHKIDRRTKRESGISWIEPGPPPQAPGENVLAVGSLRLLVFITR
jgi:hypothetical protein